MLSPAGNSLALSRNDTLIRWAQVACPLCPDRHGWHAYLETLITSTQPWLKGGLGLGFLVEPFSLSQRPEDQSDSLSQLSYVSPSSLLVNIRTSHLSLLHLARP